MEHTTLGLFYFALALSEQEHARLPAVLQLGPGFGNGGGCPLPPFPHCCCPVQADGFPTSKAPQSGLLLSHSQLHEQLCQMMFKYDPFNQVTQCNTSKMMMRWMPSMRSLFLSPLILPCLSWITLLKMWQVYVSHNRAVTILAPARIQHDTRIVPHLTLFDKSVYRMSSSVLGCTEQGQVQF